PAEHHLLQPRRIWLRSRSFEKNLWRQLWLAARNRDRSLGRHGEPATRYRVRYGTGGEGGAFHPGRQFPPLRWDKACQRPTESDQSWQVDTDAFVPIAPVDLDCLRHGVSLARAFSNQPYGASPVQWPATRDQSRGERSPCRR